MPNGMGTTFGPQQIERERRQPYFDREYCAIYAGGIGNVLVQNQLTRQLRYKTTHYPLYD